MLNDKDMIGTDAYLRHSMSYEDYFYLLPDDIKERVNTRAERRHFRSDEELRRYVAYLARKA